MEKPLFVFISQQQFSYIGNNKFETKEKVK